ncbi:peptidoglycan D,D-transpeptidase FtsI family protein [Murimonas intestini]|uniref:Stage V sporulation protein D (Sporulation-specific penicillin-binding protein) n=1 Tax=Murimonas intestini TaxID=1337051 RepID=A0AB73T7Q4_9FIRM|nr:penicillin-binding transpeptidase domain-containing protein [Murimonas intestini]MCR1839677.1 penicillin-binding transpeptidase domain-containing protein [Murimonas intestini]MCR1866520.1 penicillin-binding transpeptidase domain-containing protein [Murimonas intestini]MCR1884856.1 penicillin-binding transpeptidase domain-containing protein [Murimonas intestini]
MLNIKTYHKKKIVVVFTLCFGVLIFLVGRLGYLMLFQSDYYSQKAQELHERERDIKAARGKIIDATGKVLATNKTVCTISVIHSQLKEPDKVVEVLSKELGLSEEKVRKRVEKVTSIERVMTNVEKEVGDRIREYDLAGVKIDEDFKRYYPLDDLASKVLGFTGSDNQGIVGLEVQYEDVLKGDDGQILTMTDARGVELPDAGEGRLEPVAGNDLYISLDSNIQKYIEQEALKVKEQKSADSVSVIVMRPSNGEILGMTNVPEFNLNEPFTLNVDSSSMSDKEKQDALNQMWRNGCINDTYEPGSTFKIITAAAGLEEGVVSLNDQFSCPGFKIVEDRRIHCHKRAGHGAETFLQGAMNSCNPVFIEVGLRLGVDNYFKYFEQFGLMDKTGIDLPGEAGTIMHKKENVGEVELATISFGQSFQITPIQLAATAASIVNGGKRITPHFGVEVRDQDNALVEVCQYPVGDQIISEETSKTMQYILENVVDGGSGKNAYIEGYHIGGKTATSQTLPRSANKYISSFVGFAPMDDPQVLVLLIINNPQGVYYGGTIAAPVVKEIFSNILPYLGVERDPVTEAESETN